MADIFYVYEHWRSDKNECFWVGKGKGRRAYDFCRSLHYNNVVKKLSRLGLPVDVRIIQSNLSEDNSLSMEKERIAYWKSLGVPLTNITEGGEGVCGLKHSEETRLKIREKRAKQKIVHSRETIEKISVAQRGIPRGRNLKQNEKIRGRKQSPESIAKRVSANLGKKRSEEARSRMSAAQKGHAVTDEARLNMSVAHLGKKQSAETIKKKADALRGRKRDPSIGEKCRAAQKGKPKNPESIAKMIATLRSPEFREKVSGENHWRSKARASLCT